MAIIDKIDNDSGQGRLGDEIIPMRYEWSTSTTSAAGSPNIKFDNATYSSVLFVRVYQADYNGLDNRETIKDMQSGGTLLVASCNDRYKTVLFRITGDPVQAGSTISIPVTFISQNGSPLASDFAEDEPMYIVPFPAPVTGDSSEFGDDVFRVIDNGDNTKKIAFEASSITTATVRTVTMPDTDVDLGDIATNNVKVTNAIHTGDAIGATALTLATVNSDVGSYVKPTLTVNAKGLVTAVADGIIGGVTLSSSSNTNILNGTYVILADTTTVTSVTSGIGQDSNWTLEVTQAGITDQKGVITFTGNLEKDAGGGANYDVAIFKNGSIVSESEQVDQKLESDGKGQSVTVMAIIEFSTNDTFDIRVAGNGTANDIFCGGGSLYIQ
jgi:hypothetical protein